MVLNHIQKSNDQFFILHRNDIIQILADIGENCGSRRFHGRAVRNRINAVKCGYFPGLYGRLHTICTRRFHADNLNFGIQQLGKRRNARRQSAAANGNQNIIHERQFFDNFHRNRALTGRHLQIIKGMDKGITFFFRKLIRICTGFIINVTVQNNFRSVAFRSVDLDERRRRRHNDGRLNVVAFGRIGNTLRMISRGSRNQPSLSLFLRKRAHLIISAPQFIGSGKLHIFRLQIYFVPCLRAEIIAEHQFGLRRYLFYNFACLLKFL